MAAGIQAFDRNSGAVMLDLTSKVSKLLGYVDSGTSDGSKAIPEFSQGTPFFVIVPLSSQGTNGRKPVVRLSGNTLIWEFLYERRGGVFSVNCRIFYGVY